MDKLVELIEQLASILVMADPSDLPVLGEIHTQFEAIAERAVGALSGTVPPELAQTARDAGAVVEAIILQEADDLDAAMGQLIEAITLIQRQTIQASQRDPDEALASVQPAPLPTDDVANEEDIPLSEPTEPAAPQAAEPSAAVPEAATTEGASDELILEDEGGVSEEDSPLVVEFIGEAAEHIESAEAGLLELEEQPDNMDVINSIFRAFHTIKGVAGFINLRQIGALAHSAENLLDLARKGKLQLAGVSVDVVLESIDLMKVMFTSLETALNENRSIEAQPKLPNLLKRITACAAGETPEPRLGEILVDQGAVSESDVSEAVEKQTQGSVSRIGEILVEQKKATPKQVTQALREQRTKKPAGGGKTITETTVKLSTQRLDRLINLVGEIVIAQSMVSQDVERTENNDERLERDISHMSKITRELQDLSMSMRMVPVRAVFQKMARLVRDLSRKAGKEVDFVVTGAETELDRNVVEAIGDPLVHMVRNSVDHGLESPDDREAAGKSRVGRVELKAYHQAGNIVIEVIDDGKGLDKKRILEKAIATGVVKEGQEMSDGEIFRLIFHAGLSTAEKITDVSGRGVGMDVVRKNIETLRGRIDIESAPGIGSTFSMRLPLTLAIIDGQVIKVGSERYIIPIISIEQSIKPTREQISTVQNKGELLMIRGELLPLFRIHRLFEVDNAKQDPTEALVVIVQDNQRRCCLLVDELLGQQQVVIKSLGESFGSIRGVSGGAILGDGNVSLILDVPGLIDLASVQTTPTAVGV